LTAPKGAGPNDAIASIRPRNEVLPGSLISDLTTNRNPQQLNCGASLKRPDRNAEARIQAAVLEWLKAFAPELIVFHVPNQI
jgi:hypothetical protein